jgi:hypothetical protein
MGTKDLRLATLHIAHFPSLSKLPSDQIFEKSSNLLLTNLDYCKSLQLYAMTGRFNIQYILDTYLPQIDCIQLLMTHAFRSCTSLKTDVNILFAAFLLKRYIQQDSVPLFEQFLDTRINRPF